MAYRDEQQALLLEVVNLERENKRLEQALDDARERIELVSSQAFEEQRKKLHRFCVMCEGTLLPVAIVAGHDVRNPLPLKMSTLRFGSPDGGFTASAPLRSFACTTCGYIHNFIDMQDVR